MFPFFFSLLVHINRQAKKRDNMIYIILFLIGFGMLVSGGVTIILYMNFLPAGISWLEYFSFISKRIECYFLVIGFFIVYFSIDKFHLYMKRDE